MDTFPEGVHSSAAVTAHDHSAVLLVIAPLALSIVLLLLGLQLYQRLFHSSDYPWGSWDDQASILAVVSISTSCGEFTSKASDNGKPRLRSQQAERALAKCRLISNTEKSRSWRR